MVQLITAAAAAPDMATQVELDAAIAGEVTARNAAIAAGDVKLSGDIVQTVSTLVGTIATGTTLIPLDDTLPQITEGTEVLTATITPTSAANILEIEVLVNGANSAATNNLIAALFQDSTANALTASSIYMPSNNTITPIKLVHRMTAGTTSATTFRVRVGGNLAGTFTLNGAGAARYFGGALISSIIVREFKS